MLAAMSPPPSSSAQAALAPLPDIGLRAGLWRYRGDRYRLLLDEGRRQRDLAWTRVGSLGLAIRAAARETAQRFFRAATLVLGSAKCLWHFGQTRYATRSAATAFLCPQNGQRMVCTRRSAAARTIGPAMLHRDGGRADFQASASRGRPGGARPGGPC
jgi:hypothetical protein